MELQEANEVMGIVNKCMDTIKEKKEEFDKKRMHSEKARLIFEGLRFAFIEVCEMQGKIDEMITK